jgi:hypothetical protein
MQRKYDILIMGASYGSLLGAKLLLAGHTVKLVCLPAEADLINSEGFRVRLPLKGTRELVEIDTRKLSGNVSASGTGGVDPAKYDLVALAMQEPQYASPGVRELLQAVAHAQVPCMSIMNMPPLPYLARIPGLDVAAFRHCYTDASVWDAFDPSLMTLCSPDPQAFRPPGEKVNVLQVSLPTNFKAARFVSDEHTAMLRQLEADIEATRFETASGPVELPVKLKVHDSVFVPLAKWSMLLTGNYRCVQQDGVRSIRDAVHADIDASRDVYRWVAQVCKISCRSRNMRMQRWASRSLRRRHAHWPPARATSSASIGSCRPPAYRKACTSRPSTASWRSSTRGWRAIARPAARRSGPPRQHKRSGAIARPRYPSGSFPRWSRRCLAFYRMSIPTVCSSIPSSFPIAR